MKTTKTNSEAVNEVLEKIREVCDLKRLSIPNRIYVDEPVQLNHLLLALGEEIDITPCTEDGVSQLEIHAHFGGTYYYNLQKSVEDNLHSNPELTKWVHGVIIGKE